MAFELASWNGRSSEEIDTDPASARMLSARAGFVRVSDVCACVHMRVCARVMWCVRVWVMFVRALIVCATLA